nr:hypothetical protein [Candidatus Woesebacteria bacterium]
MQDYIVDKTAIFAYQDSNDYFITLHQTNDRLTSQGFVIPSRVCRVSTEDFGGTLQSMHGNHNIENAALAQRVSELLLPKIDHKAIQSHIGSLHGMKFRQEIILSSDRITVVNDSTSTTPISTITALKTFHDRNIILILGGNSKNLEISSLIEEIRKHQDRIITITLLKGSLTDEVYIHLLAIPGLEISEIYEDFSSAVSDSVRTLQNSNEPTYLLFSPGATSFAQFKNEFDRGEKFSQIISDIMK